LAAAQAWPDHPTAPYPTFEDVFTALIERDVDRALIPIENSVAGRVADIHHLLPESGLHIVAEHFQRVNHHLLALPGATIGGLKSVRSHIQGLSQCRRLIRELGLVPVVAADTAGSAAEVAAAGDPTEAAIASSLAGEIYGLVSLRAGIEDADHNTTRFLIMGRDPIDPDATQPTVTSLVFRVRSVPAALYKALGGFATNGVNITKLESYMIDGAFTVAQFYADIDGHPSLRPVRLALEELSFFSREVRIMGVYPASTFRRGGA